MPRVRIVHTTEYFYSQPVRFTPHRLMLRPRDSHDLRLLDALLGLSPAARALRWAHDVFGNSVCYVEFGDAPAERLGIVSMLELEHYPAGPDLPRETLDAAAEFYPFRYPAEEFPDLSRTMERQFRDREVENWASRFLRRGTPTRTMDLLSAITQAIKADFFYVARLAEGTQSPDVTLRTGSGACRDFAVLMMEAVRSLGFSARFVSGYLYDEALVEAAEPVVGGGTTHAWCAVYLPGAGWVEFDPTNGLIAGRNLIRVSAARTPEQAIPISGGFVGGSEVFDTLSVNVEVSVGGGRFVPPPTAQQFLSR